MAARRAAEPMARIPFDPATDYYKLLEVEPGASVEEIQAAYRKLAKAYHPDLNAGSAVAAAHMARVNAAKSVLLDADTRAIYDQVRRRSPVHARVVAATASRPRPTATEAPTTVRYSPFEGPQRPRHRVVPTAAAQSVPRGGIDRGTGVLLLVAVPLIAALVLYVFQAMQLSIQPLKPASVDAILSPGTNNRPTARGAADAVFQMVHTQPPSHDLAMRANNFIVSRSDGTPDGELLRADGRRLIRAADNGDVTAWDATVNDVCQLAGRCTP